jgi:hypothetical protein
VGAPVPPEYEPPHVHGGAGAPSGNGYTKIYSTYGAFAALKADGSITILCQWVH